MRRFIIGIGSQGFGDNEIPQSAKSMLENKESQ